MLNNVYSIDTSIYKQVLDFNIQTGNNLIVLGMAGVGKTEMAIQSCKKNESPYICLNMSVLEPPDLIGLPTIENKRVEYAIPKFLPVRNAESTHKKTVLIVDELDKLKSDMNSPLLELFQFHSINGTPLDIQAIVATGNLPDEGAFSQPISMALTNRCKVYQLTHSFEAWRDWAQESDLNPLVIGFLMKNQEYLSMPPIEGDPTAYSRPSPRSWSQASSELNMTDPKQHSVDFQSMLVAGRVGTAAAVKFKTWLQYSRHIEPLVDELWENGKFPSSNDMTIDKQLVCAIMSVDMVSRTCRRTAKNSQEKARKDEQLRKGTVNVFKWLGSLSSEFQIGACKSTLNMKLVQDNELTKIPELMKVYLNIRKALKD